MRFDDLFLGSDYFVRDVNSALFVFRVLASQSMWSKMGPQSEPSYLRFSSCVSTLAELSETKLGTKLSAFHFL